MFFNVFKEPHCYAMLIGSEFSIVSAVRHHQDDYRYFPKLENKNTIKKRMCDFILNHRDYDAAIVEAPNLPDHELPKAIYWEAVKLFGSGDQLLFDFYHLPTNHHNQKKMLNVVAAEKNYIKYVKERAGSKDISLGKITIPEIIYKNAKLKDFNDSRFCVVVANKDIGKVIIIENNEVYFSRKFNLSYEKAGDSADYESILLLELQRSLDYCERQYRMVMPTHFFVVGDAVNKNVLSRIKDNVSIHIKTDFPWDKVFVGREDLSSDHRFLLSVSYL